MTTNPIGPGAAKLSFLNTAWDSLTSWLWKETQEVESFVVKGAQDIWAVLEPGIKALEPQEWATFLPLVEEAIADLGTGNLADLETSVLMKAEAAGLQVIKTLDSMFIQGVIAWVASKVSKAA